MIRLRLALACLAAFALLGAGLATAAGGPTYPKTGKWSSRWVRVVLSPLPGGAGAGVSRLWAQRGSA